MSCTESKLTTAHRYQVTYNKHSLVGCNDNVIITWFLEMISLALIKDWMHSDRVSCERPWNVAFYNAHQTMTNITNG